MREYKFITSITAETPPPLSAPPTGDEDLVPNKYVNAYRTLDLANTVDGVQGQIVADRPYLIINANTGSKKLKGLVFIGLSEVTLINSTGVDVAVEPAPSNPSYDFIQPPQTIPNGKAYKFIRDYDDSRWVAIGGGGGADKFVGEKIDLANLGTIPIDQFAMFQTWRIRGALVAVNLATQLFGTTAKNGMQITLVCDDDNKTVTVKPGTGGVNEYMGPEVTLAKGKALVLEYSSTIGWFVISNPN